MRNKERQKAYMKGYNKKYNQEHREALILRHKIYYQDHQDERRAYSRKRWQEQKGDVVASNTKWANKTRVETFTHYGNGKLACVMCGFDNIKALSIDHINGNGNKERKALGFTVPTRFYAWLRKQGFPEGYRTLCMNCQHIAYKTKLETMAKALQGREMLK